MDIYTSIYIHMYIYVYVYIYIYIHHNRWAALENASLVSFSIQIRLVGGFWPFHKNLKELAIRMGDGAAMKAFCKLRICKILQANQKIGNFPCKNIALMSILLKILCFFPLRLFFILHLQFRTFYPAFFFCTIAYWECLLRSFGAMNLS